MPRRTRVEFPGACYHVFNRGNYRQPVFLQGRAADVFESLLFESCERFSWELYAHTVMSNHFHLALRTKTGRLSEGMKWLQGTFAKRFNNYVKAPGSLFQGRFKSPIIEPGPSLLRVVNYIHLNPVKAGLIPLSKLDQFRHSSFRRFFHLDRPECLHCEEWLTEAGPFPTSRMGMKAYWKYLELVLAKDLRNADILDKELCRGWYIGSEKGKTTLLQELKNEKYSDQELSYLDPEAVAEWLLKRGLELLGKAEADLLASRKGIDWKCALSRFLKRKTGVSNTWLANRLRMGHPKSVSRLGKAVPRTPEERRMERDLEKLWKCEL